MTPAAAGDSSDEGGQSDDDDDDDDDEEEEEDGGEFVHGEGVGMSEAEERLVASFMNAGVWHYYVVRLLFCCFVVLLFRPPLPPRIVFSGCASSSCSYYTYISETGATATGVTWTAPGP